MQQAIEKAATLVEALQWIKRFRDKITVVKLGGRLLDDPNLLRDVLIDVHFMQTVGMKCVIVHGGGAQIDRALAERAIAPTFVRGRRFTDDVTLEVVRDVLAGQVNALIAETLEAVGGRAMTLNFDSTCVLYGERLQLTDEHNQPIELGHVGSVTHVDRLVIDNLCYAGQVPIIPSMCLTADGQVLNVNADTAATAVARELNAEKLVLLSDVPGVLRDPKDDKSVISTLDRSTAQEMMRTGAIDRGMIPKVEACLETLEHGVSKVHIIDGRIKHSLLLEVYTTRGLGTQIVSEEAAGTSAAVPNAYAVGN